MLMQNEFRIVRFILIILSLSIELVAGADFETISGELPSVVKKGEKPYLVTSTLEVKEGEEVTIEKGAVFLFKNFTGINVMGSIKVKGTEKDPVIFTSENDTLFNPSSSLEPAPFDWDGITVNPGMEKNIFEHCSIKYSLFGIKSLTQNITLKKCSFIQNGSSDFTINDEKQPVTHPLYSYSSTGKESSMAVEVDTTTPDVAVQEVEEGKEVTVSKKVDLEAPEEEVKKKRKKKVPLVTEPPGEKKERKSGKIVIRMLSLTTAFVGIAGGVVQYLDFKAAKEEFYKYDDASSQENLMNPNIQEEWENAKNSTNDHQKFGYLYGGIALAGMAFFTISFAF